MRPLTAKQVAERLGYTARTVYAYAKTGRLPAPIDAELPIRMWRWSPAIVDRYEAGEWKPVRPTRPMQAVAS